MSTVESDITSGVHRHPYLEYRESGVDWLGKIPVDWEVVHLKRIASIKYGLGEPPALLTGGLPFIRATNIAKGKIIDHEMQFVDPADVPWKRDPALRTGDVVIVRSGAYTGDSALIPEEYNGSIAGYDMVVRPKSMVPGFLAWSVISQYVLDAQIELQSTRAAQPHLNAEELGSVGVLCPPVVEQRAIAAFLDHETAKIDALMSTKERLIELLQEKRAALIARAVTKGLDPSVPLKDSGVEWLGEIPKHWRVGALKRFATMRAGIAITSDDIEPDGAFPVYGGNGIRGYTESYTHEGDYPLIGRQGALCGCVCFASGRFWASEHAVVVACASDVEPHWLARLLEAMSLNDYSESAAQPGLAVDTIGRLEVPMPPMYEQLAIADFLTAKTNEHDGLITKVNQAIQYLKEHRTALISAAVTGKIDLRSEHEDTSARKDAK